MNAVWFSNDYNKKCKNIQNFNELLEILKNDGFKQN